MHSKISSLAAVAAVAALVTPALAVDDHLVPVPADVVPEVAAATTGADAKDAALPTGPPIPFPEINGFPKPPAPGYQNGKADTTSTTTPTTYTTWCPDPTVITWGKLTTSVTTKGYITLTDCELNTTTTTTPYTTVSFPPCSHTSSLVDKRQSKKTAQAGHSYRPPTPSTIPQARTARRGARGQARRGARRQVSRDHSLSSYQAPSYSSSHRHPGPSHKDSCHCVGCFQDTGWNFHWSRRRSCFVCCLWAIGRFILGMFSSSLFLQG